MDTPHDGGGEPAAAPDPELRVLHGRYRIERALGKGGMGEVLLATDELLHRRVALKHLHATGEDRGERRRAMLKEARRASQINDAHVASIYDVLDSGDDITLVMEYVDGITLRQRMTRPVSLAEFWDIATQCVEGVAAAHAHNVVHRDIKPENLMVTGKGRIKILDFGIARRTAPGLDATDSLTDSRMRGVAGTPQYMAPEAHLGTEVDERTDLFSLGVVFYELLAGRRPFEGATYGAVLEQVLNATPPAVTDVNPAAGPEIARIVATMLAKSPDARFDSAATLKHELANARRTSDPAWLGTTTETASSRGWAVRGIGRSARRWRPSRTTAAGSLVAIAAVAVAGVWWRNESIPALPRDVTLAVLAPATPNATDDFASFALGAVDLLGARLQHHADRPGFQVSPVQESLDAEARSPGDARKLLGANVALASTVEEGPDALRGRLELRETERGRVIASRTITSPVSQPFAFLDRVYRDAVAMLGQAPRGADTSVECGFRGAGTLRYYLQGLGRIRAATTDEAGRKAVEDLERACETDPGAAATRAGLARAQLKMRTVAHDSTWLVKAEDTARQSVALGPDRSETHRALANVLEAQKRPQESLIEFARAADLNPNDGETRYRLGRTYARLGQAEKERAVYADAIRLRPHWFKPYWWLASYEFRAGRIDEAIAAYQGMIRNAPLFETGYSSLGGLLILKGDYDGAIAMLRHAIALRPTKTAYGNLGTAYFNSGRFTESIEAYNQSFQFGSPDYVTWLNLGDAFFWLRDRKQATGAYQQSIRMGRDEIGSRARSGRPEDPMIFADLATVFPRLAQPDSARAYLREALRADSTNSRVQYCVALTYWQLDEKERAMAWLTRSVQGGYPRVWLRDSPVFDDWRQVPEFRALVSEPKPKAAGRAG